MKVGLVLAGGGARGAYQIGVWKALKELGVDRYIDVIAGTSIGALNGVLFKQGNIDSAEKLWNDITREKILPTDNIDLLKKSTLLNIGSRNLNLVKKYIPKAVEGGNVSRSGLIEIFDEYVDFDKIRDNKITIYATCTVIPKLEATYFKLNDYEEEDIRKILLATSALPKIYKSEEIDGNKYLDGGIVDNLPIQPVYGEGCNIIIVVPLSKDCVIDRNLYPNTDIILINPKDMESGVIEGTLDFSKDNSLKRIISGYNDAKDQLVPIFNLANMISDRKRDEERRKKMLFNIIKDKLFSKEDKSGKKA